MRLASTLDGWTPADPLPGPLTPQTLRQIADHLDRASRPPTPEEWAGAVGLLRRLATAFAIPVDDWTLLSRLYAEGLKDVPADLLRLGVERILRHWSNGFRLPMPGELRTLIAPELAARSAALAKLRCALATTTRKPQPFRPETRAEAEARRQKRSP